MDGATVLALAALGVWFASTASAGGDGIGLGGKASARTKRQRGDELADLPDELDAAAIKLRRDAAKLRAPKGTKGAKGAPVIEVKGPKVRPATAAERDAAAKKKAAKKPGQRVEGDTPPRRKPPGTVSASPELEPHHGPSHPPGYDPAQARARAPAIAALLARKGPKAYPRAALAEWQRLAGIRVDGEYAGSTRGALVHYGVDDPPRPFGQPYATLPYHPPDLTP